MTLTAKTFEGYSAGTVATTGNTGAAALGGATGGAGPTQNSLVFATGGVHGNCILFTNVSTGNVSGMVADFAPSSAQTTLSARVAFKLPASLPSADAGILRINTPTTRATVINMTVGGSGLVFLDKANVSTTIMSSANLNSHLGQWIQISQVLIGGTTTAGVVQIKCYDSSGTQIGSTVNLTTANLTTETLSLLRVGLIGNSQGSISVDEVQLNDGSTSEIAAYTPPSNVLPSVTVGADQTIPATGTAVTVTSTSTDSDGSIASKLWTFTQYPHSLGSAPTLSGSTTNSATFTPSVTGWYQLQFTATDDAGGSSSATTNVFVPGTSPKTVQVVTNTGPWTVTTSTDELSDGSDSTFIESPNSPTTAALRLRLEPMVVATTFSMVVRGKVSAAGTNTETIKLYENTTLRKTWTLPLTTTLSSFTLTMNSTELGFITDFNRCALEFGATLS